MENPIQYKMIASPSVSDFNRACERVRKQGFQPLFPPHIHHEAAPNDHVVTIMQQWQKLPEVDA